MSRARCATCSLQNRVRHIAHSAVQSKLAKSVSLLVLYGTLAMYFLPGSTKAAMMPGNTIHLGLMFFTLICKGQYAAEIPCADQEQHQDNCRQCRQT